MSLLTNPTLRVLISLKTLPVDVSVEYLQCLPLMLIKS